MDENSRRRRQNESPMHAPANPRYQQSLQDASQQQRRAYAGSGSDRYRTGSAPSATSPLPAASRGLSGSANYSGYYQEPAATAYSATTLPQGAAMGYQQPATDYGQDTRQTQGFASTYNPLMYNVPQAGPQSSVYDTSQQYSARQPAALQMISTDVTTPYFPSESASAATATGMQSQTAPSSASTGVYQQSPADRTTLMQGYSAPGMSDVAGGMSGQSASAADVTMDEAEFSVANGLDDAYNSYQSAIKQIFENIHGDILAPTSETLLGVSEWLLSHVAELGLTADDANLRDQRIELWTDFNNAWLAIFQRQKELMESGHHSQNLISQDKLEKMGKDLIKWCDNIERHGLVDYQYGVEEERIIDILVQCLDLYEHEGDGGGTAMASASRH